MASLPSNSAHTTTHTEEASTQSASELAGGFGEEATASASIVSGEKEGAETSLSTHSISASIPAEPSAELSSSSSREALPSLPSASPAAVAYAFGGGFAPSSASSSDSGSLWNAQPAPVFGSSSALEPSALPNDASVFTEDELTNAAQRILDRARRIDAEMRALPPPLFHAGADSSPPAPLDLSVVRKQDMHDDRVQGVFQANPPSLLSVVLLSQQSDVGVTLAAIRKASDRDPFVMPARELCHFAVVQLRVEQHVEQKQLESLAAAVRESSWRRSPPTINDPQLLLSWLLWSHAIFDRWETAESFVSGSFTHLCTQLRPAHALHFLSTLDDARLLASKHTAQTSVTSASVQQWETVKRVCLELSTQWARLIKDTPSANESQQRDAVISLRRWIREKQSSLPSLLVEAKLVEFDPPNFAAQCLLLLDPLIDDLTARINYAEREGFHALLSRMLRELDEALPEVSATQRIQRQQMLTRLERRIRAQSDEQLERDSAFEAVAAVCCEIPLTEGRVAHSVVDHLLSRLSRRLLASGSRLCLSPTFYWKALLEHGRFAFSSFKRFSVSLRPTVRLLLRHGLTANHYGADYCIAVLEDQYLDDEAAQDLFSPDCDDLSMREVDWLSPSLSVPGAQNPMADGRVQSLLFDGSSFEEEHIRSLDPSASVAGSASSAASSPSTVLSSAALLAFAPRYEEPSWYEDIGWIGPRQLTQWIEDNARQAAADTILSRPAFNLLSAHALSSPILAADRFDLRTLPAEYSERMAALGRLSDCFSGVALVECLHDCDLLRRLGRRVVQHPSLQPRLELLRSAASRWYHRCFPQLRAEIEAQLIPDLASIVLSYVTADERVLRSLPPPAPLPLPAVGAFAPHCSSGRRSSGILLY